MHVVAPNLSSLIGEVVGARLISHAGSLTNLAKYPASTVQILGAEKALFRWESTNPVSPLLPPPPCCTLPLHRPYSLGAFLDCHY